jgi:hypothetical protein
MDDHVYYEGNGRFKAFLPPDYPPAKIALVEGMVSRQMSNKISNRLIKTFALETYANPASCSTEESDKRLELLEKNIERVQNAANKRLIKVSDIPHPKSANKTLGIEFYDDRIASGESVEEGLRKINVAVEERLRSQEKRAK